MKDGKTLAYKIDIYGLLKTPVVFFYGRGARDPLWVPRLIPYIKNLQPLRIIVLNRLDFLNAAGNNLESQFSILEVAKWTHYSSIL